MSVAHCLWAIPVDTLPAQLARPVQQTRVLACCLPVLDSAPADCFNPHALPCHVPHRTGLVPPLHCAVPLCPPPFLCIIQLLLSLLSDIHTAPCAGACMQRIAVDGSCRGQERGGFCCIIPLSPGKKAAAVASSRWLSHRKPLPIPVPACSSARCRPPARGAVKSLQYPGLMRQLRLPAQDATWPVADQPTC